MYQVEFEKSPYDTIYDWWPSEAQILNVIDSVIKSVKCPSDVWPKIIDQNDLIPWTSQGWEVRQSKSKNFFIVEIRYRNHSIAYSKGTYKSFPPLFSIHKNE